MRRKLGNRAEIIPEDEFLPGMNIEQLKQVVRFGFPKMAGWYFQQFETAVCLYSTRGRFLFDMGRRHNSPPASAFL